MPAILRIKNDYGTTLISSGDPTLAMRQSGSVTLNGSGEAVVTIYNCEFPTLAARCTSMVGLKSTVRSDTTTTYTIKGAPGAVVYWYYFDRPEHSGGGKVVLRVRNPNDGKLTFDSGRRIGKVVGTVQNDNHTWTGTAGRTYAVILDTTATKEQYWNVSYVRDGANYETIQYWNHGWSTNAILVNGASVQTGWVESIGYVDEFVGDMGYSVAPPDNVIGVGMVQIILDVTGY